MSIWICIKLTQIAALYHSFTAPLCYCITIVYSIRGADKSLDRPGRKQANVSVRMAWISFGALPCRKRNLMTARVSMLLKSRASLICFWACFLPGLAKDLSSTPGSVLSFFYHIQYLPIIRTIEWVRRNGSVVGMEYSSVCIHATVET